MSIYYFIFKMFLIYFLYISEEKALIYFQKKAMVMYIFFCKKKCFSCFCVKKCFACFLENNISMRVFCLFYAFTNTTPPIQFYLDVGGFGAIKSHAFFCCMILCDLILKDCGYIILLFKNI